MDAQAQKQQQQLERLRKDLGAVDMSSTRPTGGDVPPGQTVLFSLSCFYCGNQPIDFLSTEEADVAGPSDLIMTRGNRDDNEEEDEESDTDDIDHSGKQTNEHKQTNTT